ncbi:uncharacterized protein LOC123524347 isoform X21 [Mercenaria mercenaria]|uniref:uncharacterized protein LOC123524347 isoform X21 n=1 Tax=Mercenaria mercenaria TaxID=6596 RepID=UPI00234E83C4|nr:uncharacterized protein LOC123524347 isoform X21 [Mercenaria mercenaria]
MWPSKHYVFPTREAYRYHFKEPPAAPLQHDEVKRARQIMNWDRKSRDLEPMMSERTELDYQMASEIVRKDAPFGTDSTPNITLKIIGGRQVPVIEKHPVYNNDYAGSRIQPLRPIADKPNHLDPRIHGDNPGGYYHKDVQEIYTHPLEHKGFDFEKFYEELGDKPTNFANKRPDSKDVVRGQFKALPPIQQNRTRNDLSTVFEAEPWTDNRNPPLAHDTEYKQNFYLGRDSENGMDHYNSGGQKDFHYVSESEQKNLFMLLPRNVLLPVDPIKLTRDQEATLCKLICNELNRFDPKELRDVYIECSQHDKELRGFCGIEILDNNLRRHKAFLADTLRIAAAQFVDPNYPGKVNYEKTLSLIGSALNLNATGQLDKRLNQPAPKQEVLVDTDKDVQNRSQERQPKYYMQNGESFKTGSIYRDREVAKLLRMVEQELSKNTYAMDWTRWQNSFYERDRDHRETLSAAQIKDICYDQKLPLSDSLINHILNLCEDNNRDGQYRWHSFLEFLSRVRPSNTGLPIPVSKRPLEYAKHYPAPVPNWPRTDADTERRGTSPRRDISPMRGQIRQDERNETPVMRVTSPKERKEKKDEDNSGYQPSWQQNAQQRSTSPPYPRRINERDRYRREERPEDSPYEGHWKNWAYRSNRKPRALQRVPSRYERPKSYAEPQRKTSFPNLEEQRRRPFSYRDELRIADQYYGRPPSRLQTPLRRTQSLSPVRNLSPIRGQPVPYTYRDAYGAQSYRDYNRQQYPYEQMGSYSYRYNDRDNYQQQQMPQQQMMQQREGRDSFREGNRQGGGGRGRGDDTHRSREQQIMQLSTQLHDLESKYEVTKEAMSSRDKPWLDRYLKLAQALYDSDISYKGSLPRKDVMDIVNQYNNAFNLNLDMTRANMLSISPENLDKSGNIILRSFLANLSSDRISYKV